MSKANTEIETDVGTGTRDHRDVVDWLAISRKRGSSRKLHKVAGDPEEDDLELNENVETACETTLTSGESAWIAKPATVFPPGHKELCQHPACFGADADDLNR